jgi:hypothetical protein
MSDAKRLKSLSVIIENIKAGKFVQDRTLQTHLTKDEYEDYLNDKKLQKDYRSEIKDKPAEVIEYEQFLKSACLIYNRAEAYSNRGKSKNAKLLFNKADTLFERALEHLQEIIKADRSLMVWFDRDTTWDADNNDISLAPVGMPRCVTSRSLDNLSSGHFLKNEILTSTELKLRSVQFAYDRLIEQPTEYSDVQKSKLLNFLNNLDKDEF